MDVRAVFGINVLLSLISAGIAAKLFVWHRLQGMDRSSALIPLVVPHMFLRFIGLSFLIPGVVSPSLPASFAVPAAYGDLAAGILAIVATIALVSKASFATAAVWLFNVWGATDFLLGFYWAARAQVLPGAFGAAYFIVTAVVPVLLVMHVLIFALQVSPVRSFSLNSQRQRA
jgi:hypothetical protein